MAVACGEAAVTEGGRGSETARERRERRRRRRRVTCRLAVLGPLVLVERLRAPNLPPGGGMRSDCHPSFVG